jgi:hypothetical protein
MKSSVSEPPFGEDISGPEFKRLMKTVESRLQPKVAAINGDDKDVIAANKHYIKLHERLPKNFQSLSGSQLEKLGKELLDRRTHLERKEEILLILAHNGCWDALKPLEKYVRNPDARLRLLAELAFEECRFWFDKDPYGRDADEQLFMGFDPLKVCPCGSGKIYGECHGTLPYGPPTGQFEQGKSRSRVR